MQQELLEKRIIELYKLKRLGFEYVEPFSVQSDMIKSLPNTIDELQNAVFNCHICNIAKSRKNVVFGEGNTKAKLMIIGEAPGQKEDELGRPFVGRSGELLTKMIENVLKLKREEVYIANIIKCRPPLNRDPNEDEIIACRGFLDKQIELIKPKLILSLGRVSFKSLTNSSLSISKARGQLFRYNNITLIPSFHPSYLLRNPSAKKEAFADLLLVLKMLNLHSKT